MKEKYLKELNESLSVAFSYEEANAITKDYEELFDDFLSAGLTEQEVINKIGEPREIVQSLIEENKRMFPVIGKSNVVLPKKLGRKLIKIIPFISLIIFLILGYTLQAWHPGWLVFFLIPISAVLFAPYKKRKLIGVTPFLAVTIFILIGTYVKNGYQYSWIAFLFIPLIGILDS